MSWCQQTVLLLLLPLSSAGADGPTDWAMALGNALPELVGDEYSWDLSTRASQFTHDDTVQALAEVFEVYFLAVDRLVNASRALLQQQRPGGNAASPDRAAGGSAAAADDDADADADATVGSGGGSAPYEYGGYMLDDGTIVWSQPKHAKEKEGTTSPPSPLPLGSAFFDDGVRDESAGESEGASTSTEPVGPGDDLPKATDDEDVAAESMRDSDSDNDAGYDEQHMSTVGFLPYQLRAYYPSGDGGHLRDSAENARNRTITSTMSGNATNETSNETWSAADNNDSDGNSNSSNSNSSNSTAANVLHGNASAGEAEVIPKAISGVYAQQLRQTAWVGETFKANLKVLADLGWSDLAHQTVQQLTLVSGVTQLYPPPLVTTSAAAAAAAAPAAESNESGMPGEGRGSGAHQGDSREYGEYGYDAAGDDVFVLDTYDDDADPSLRSAKEDDDDDSIVYSDGGGGSDGSNGNGMRDEDNGEGQFADDDDVWGRSDGGSLSPRLPTDVVPAYQNYNPLKDHWFVSSVAPPKSAVILLDVSGSMRGQPATFAKQVATDLLRSFSSWDRVAVLQYSDAAVTALGSHGLELVPAFGSFTKDIAADIAAINTYELQGRSYISVALEAGYGMLRDDQFANSKERSKLLFVISDGGDGATGDGVWMKPSVSSANSENSIMPKNEATGRDVSVHTYTVGSTAWATGQGHLTLSCSNDGIHTPIKHGQSISTATQDYYMKHTSCNTAVAQGVPTVERVKFTHRDANADDGKIPAAVNSKSAWNPPTLQWSNSLGEPHHHHFPHYHKHHRAHHNKHRPDEHLRKRAGIILSAPVFVAPFEEGGAEEGSEPRDGDARGQQGSRDGDRNGGSEGGGGARGGGGGEGDAATTPVAGVDTAAPLNVTMEKAAAAAAARAAQAAFDEHTQSFNHIECRNNGTLRAAVSIEIPLHAIIAGSAAKLPALDVAALDAGGYFFLVGIGGEVVSHPRLSAGAGSKSAVAYKPILEHLEPGLTKAQRKALRGDKSGSFVSTASSCDLPNSELVASMLPLYQARYTFSLLDKTPYTVVSVRPSVPFAVQQQEEFAKMLLAQAERRRLQSNTTAATATATVAAVSMAMLYPSVSVDDASDTLLSKTRNAVGPPNSTQHVVVTSSTLDAGKGQHASSEAQNEAAHPAYTLDAMWKIPVARVGSWFDSVLGDLCRSREPPTTIDSSSSSSISIGGGGGSTVSNVTRHENGTMPVTACFLVTRRQTLIASVQLDLFSAALRRNATLAYDAAAATPTATSDSSNGSNASNADAGGGADRSSSSNSSSLLVPAFSARASKEMPLCGGARWFAGSGLLPPLTVAAPGNCKPLQLSVHPVPGLAAELVVARLPSVCTVAAAAANSMQSSSCRDLRPSWCETWTTAGFCVGEHAYYMMENCRKSCMFCNEARGTIATAGGGGGGGDGFFNSEMAAPGLAEGTIDVGSGGGGAAHGSGDSDYFAAPSDGGGGGGGGGGGPMLSVDEVVEPVTVVRTLAIPTLEQLLFEVAGNVTFQYPFYANDVVPSAEGVTYPRPNPKYAELLRPLYSTPHCGGAWLGSKAVVSFTMPTLLLLLFWA